MSATLLFLPAQLGPGSASWANQIRVLTRLFAPCAGEPGIPHADFWHSLPDLVKDGYFFATEKTQGLSGKGGYEGL